MSMLHQLYEVTKALHTHVATSPSEEQRDAYIQRVDELLDARQALLSHVTKPASLEEKALAQEMITMNQAIDRALVGIKEQVAVDIRKLKIKKTKTDRYANPYANVSFDGTFYDKRK
ncbi:hypothetical protein [Metabacillus iocasae]|uniref:Flagellar protein FliT n=1 Tax=Priestia iocasae TaxID=2291674 RepID=A0ABS2QYD4_9BACI|nr:hypothetical protein [Metabacillus iocasae]MBM7704481.1 flagellar protein FliT [Metabacillus iocasae]